MKTHAKAAKKTPGTAAAASGMPLVAMAVKKSASRKKTPKVDVRPERISAILTGLGKTYPNPQCALIHNSPWELVVATILSAQCTDVRVNLVTPQLFEHFPAPESFAAASLIAIEEDIRSTGFFHNKARSISGAARVLVDKYKSKVPETMSELLELPGVARKTANVVLGVAFRKAEGIVVDTHVLRLSLRLQLTLATDPKKVEQDLVKVVPRDHWIDFSHELILHGRSTCVARKPRCMACPIEPECHSADKTWSSH